MNIVQKMKETIQIKISETSENMFEKTAKKVITLDEAVI